MGIGLGEGLLLLVIAALCLKGEEFSSAAKLLGKWMGQAQRMSRSFLEELQREMNSPELDESTKEIRKALDFTRSKTKGRPLDELMTRLEGAGKAKEDRDAPAKHANHAPAQPPAPEPVEKPEEHA